jgi:hypothetical protein
MVSDVSATPLAVDLSETPERLGRQLLLLLGGIFGRM